MTATIRVFLAAMSLGCASSETWAQAPSDETLREVLITGERLPRLWSATASSVAVVTGDTTELLAGADRVERLLSLVPNVQLGPGGEGPTIRGQDSTGVLSALPAFLGGTRPRATLQVDGRAVSFNEFVFGLASIWDVDRVEVFRSPQTTTQGRNSIGGAIFIETRDPGYTREGRVRLQAANYGTRQVSAVVSGPVVDEQLAIRIAGDLRRSQPSSQIAERMVGASPNQDDFDLLRIKLLAEPKAVPGLRLETSYVHVESMMPQVEGVVAPFRARRDPTPGYGVFSNIVDSVTGTLDYALAPALESTTTFSYGNASIMRFAPPGLGQTRTRSSDLSAELVLRWNPTGPVRALGGIHALQSRLNQLINLSAVLGVGDFADRQNSLGLFGEATLQPSARLSLTAGLRYQRDTQNRKGLLGTPALGFPIDFDKTFDAWLPKLSLSYDVTSDFRVGVLVQRAFNPGGTTLNFDSGDQDDFGAETLWNYELFARASFAQDCATLGVNLFYNDFSNAQRAQTRAYSVPGGATAFWAEINNTPAARSYGLETEVAWRASRRMSLRASLGLLATRIVETTNPTDPIRGQAFQRSPGLTASAAIDWRPTERWQLSAQGRGYSSYFSDDANTTALRIDAATVADIRANYSLGRWSVFGYAANVFDKFYLTTLSSTVRGTAGDPRKVGLGAEVRY